MRLSRSFGLLTLGLALVAVTSRVRAEPLTFNLEKGGASKVQFVSDATLEKITGVGSELSGDVTVDPEQPAKAKAEIKIPIRALRTGLELRDEHLHGSKWLDAAQFPEAVVVLSEVVGMDKLVPDQAVEVIVRGKLTLHGVTRPIEAKAKVRWTPKAKGARQSLHVTASFPISLEDHNISVPSVVTLKVAREILVNVDLHAYAS